MKSLKILGLGALMATAFVAGCPGESSDGDSIFNYLRGTNAADTLDNNWGTDAWSNPRMFVGSNGEVVFSFQQNHINNNSDPGQNPQFPYEPNVTPYNYYRVMGAGSGSIREVDWFAQNWNYEANYEAGSHSYNKRYQVGFNYNDSMDEGWLLAYDSADGAFGKPIAIVDGAFGSSNAQFGFISDLEALMVDNLGIATVIITAEGHFMTVNGENDVDELWAIRVDMNTNTVVQDWVRINRDFAEDPGIDVSDVTGDKHVFVEDWAIAINTDICLAVDYGDDYDATAGFDYRNTLESIYYDASADTWTQARIDTVDDGGSDPAEAWGSVILDTDGVSFQIAYVDYDDWTDQDDQIYSSRLDSTAGITSFPGVTILDSTDPSGGDFHYVNQIMDIVFGRDGSSVVSWIEGDNDTVGAQVFSYWASWSTDNADLGTTSFELLDVEDGTDDGYSTWIWPAFDFMNNGGFSATFTVTNDDTNVVDEELYIFTFDGTTATVPSPGTDNIADADAATGTDEDRFVDFWTSGYSNPIGGVSTNVVSFTSQFRDTTPGAEDRAYRFGVVLISDDTYGAPEYIQDNTAFPIEDWWVASTNNIKNGGSYDDQIDFLIDPDTLPAVGNGVVWVVWLQVALDDGDSGQVRPFAWNWNPNTQAGAINDLSRDILNWEGDTWYIESVNPATSGAASIFLNYLGQTVRCNVNPSTSGTVAGTTDGGTDVTPVDMAGGGNTFHCDGMSFKWTISSTNVVTNVFQGGGFIWSIWDGHDILSERVFGKRTR
ncbi:MAG: hypothetical protein IT462_09465 [Planctomycetes bacterium]|nr:hypothetical protein [Planctomycetota bacterium]